MALNLDFDVEVVRDGTRLSIFDITGVSVKNDDGKWNDAGAGGVSASDVSAATMLITYPDATTETIDFYALGYFQVAITGEFRFEFFSYTSTQYPEGKYTFLYTITTAGGASYYKTLTRYFYHKKEACVENMWIELPDKLCDSCEYDEYMESCLLAEAYLKALKAATILGYESTAESLADDIEDLCEVNNCNCN